MLTLHMPNDEYFCTLRCKTHKKAYSVVVREHFSRKKHKKPSPSYYITSENGNAMKPIPRVFLVSAKYLGEYQIRSLQT